MFPIEAFQRTLDKFVAIARQLDLNFHVRSIFRNANVAQRQIIADEAGRLNLNRLLEEVLSESDEIR